MYLLAKSTATCYMTNQLLGVVGSVPSAWATATTPHRFVMGPRQRRGRDTHGTSIIRFQMVFQALYPLTWMLCGTFQYLVVAYDGPNSGVVVWNISSLTGDDSIQTRMLSPMA